MQPCRALLAICAVLVGSACDDTTPTTVGVFEEVPVLSGVDLDVRAPVLTREMFVQYEKEEVGPAGQDLVGPPRYIWPEVQIRGPWTALATPAVGFTAGALHSFTGNRSSIETTLRVKFGNVLVGEHVAIRERTGWLTNPFAWNTVIAEAVVHNRGSCGLRATASSVHRASLQLLPGPAILDAFQTTKTSAAQPIVLPPCPERAEGAPGGVTADGEEVTCWFNVTYDLETGEVLDRELLWCDGGSGGLD